MSQASRFRLAIPVMGFLVAASSCHRTDETLCDGWNTPQFMLTAEATDVVGCLDSGADLEVRSNTLGRTPLHTAAVIGSPDVAKALLRAGANVLARDMDGSTPLHQTAQRVQGLPLGADEDEMARRREGMTAVAEALLSGGAPSEVWNRYGNTPLHLAAETGALDVVTALVEAGADLSVRDVDWNTPLHLAIARGELATAEVLLRAGADPNAEGAIHRPLHLAAARNDTAATETLLRAGADPNARNLVHVAIEQDAAAVLDALLGAGAEPPLRALYVAIDQGAWTVVGPLLRAGANPNVRGSFEKTLLHEAAENGVPVEVVELLLRAGLNPNARDDGDFTPLHMTAHNLVNPGAMAEKLIAAGADVNARAVTGETPLGMAERLENGALATVLRARGGQL